MKKANAWSMLQNMRLPIFLSPGALADASVFFFIFDIDSTWVR
ncbi:hypothetical protein B4168_1894 [Anoxybacillus flavithermus]|nr:hypothetical protein B4168_1894 [Anoxybacillus flavithermus]OAO85549.1 hypothetical protein GT23_2452 [Parageobacillus thermoglucosidasius]